MLTIAISSLAIGAALGLRFRMYVLLPAIGATMAVVASQGFLQGFRPVAILGELIAVAVPMQLGYLVGIVFHRLLARILISMRANGRSVSIYPSAHSSQTS